VGEPKGQILLERPRHMWVDNITMDLGERRIGGGGGLYCLD
jgi:hypothetical protein